MTDRSSTVGEASSPARSSARRARAGRHPLLGGFPLAVMALATFLVVFTIMMARLTAGADPALRASATPVALSQGVGGGAVSTRASGAGGAARPAVTVAAGETGSLAPAVTTRTSGAPAAGSRDD